jgi:RNA polymerase sigma-70 factor (ECF subfamily)
MPAAPPTDRVPDDELLGHATAGDAQAFAELFRRRHPDVFRFALHMTGLVSTAEDVVQDVFMVVMRDGARYDAGRGTVASWLCGIARNCVRQRLDRDRRLTPVDFADDGEPSAVDHGSVDPLAGLLRAERIETVRRAVHALPLPYREAVVLCDLQELSYGDAAAALGCPVGTVRSRLHRARTMLAARLAVSALAPAASAVDACAGTPAMEAGWTGQIGTTSTGRG